MPMSQGMAHKHGEDALRVVAVFAASFALAWLCLLMPRAAGSVTPIWLPNATLLAILILTSRRHWRAFIGAGFLGQMLANVVDGSPALVATALALCNTAEVLACAALFLKVLGRRPDLSKPRTIGLYALIAGVVATGGAGLAALFLSALSEAPGLATFATWAVADFAALVTVSPCLVLLFNNRRALPDLVSARAWPLAVLLLVAVAVFSQDRYPLNHLLVAALLLATWRLGIWGPPWACSRPCSSRSAGRSQATGPSP